MAWLYTCRGRAVADCLYLAAPPRAQSPSPSILFIYDRIVGVWGSGEDGAGRGGRGVCAAEGREGRGLEG